MRFVIPTVLGFVLLCLHTRIFGCESDCCVKSTNCGNTDCCQKTNCCQTTHCCQTTNCCQSTSICCGQVTNCCNKCHVQCRNSTCTDQCKKDCCTEATIEKLIVNNNETQPKPSDGQISNTNNNNHNISATININNSINYENRIFIPINVSNSNVNNVAVTCSGCNTPPNESTTGRPPSTPDHNHSTTPSTTPCPTKIVKIPVPIPVPGETKLIPIPYPIPYPVPQPMIGCCIIMIPCVSYGCHSFHRSCGGECSHNFMFRPIDPCGGYCHKMQFGINRHCSWSGHCQNNWMDCSMCDTNFYERFDSYQQCGGCFYR